MARDRSARAIYRLASKSWSVAFERGEQSGSG
jgi:hypothetical protein